jgi:hypothetical protein
MQSKKIREAHSHPEKIKKKDRTTKTTTTNKDIS